MKLRSITTAKLLAAALTFASPSTALADQQTAMLNGNALIAGIDTVQTCRFASPGSPYHETATRSGLGEVEAAWAIGKHPTCGVSTAWILGNAAVLYLLPHTKTMRFFVGLSLGIHGATVANNARLMAEFKL